MNKASEVLLTHFVSLVSVLVCCTIIFRKETAMIITEKKETAKIITAKLTSNLQRETLN